MEESNFIIRKIDDLGRIVIPRDKRKENGIAIKDKFKVHTEEKEIILNEDNKEKEKTKENENENNSKNNEKENKEIIENANNNFINYNILCQ